MLTPDAMFDASAFAYHMFHAGCACLAMLIVVGGGVDVAVGFLVGAWKRRRGRP
jgi:fructose-1,6-bisphosphatase/inositol monophosphatase family enzyme